MYAKRSGYNTNCRTVTFVTKADADAFVLDLGIGKNLKKGSV